ncbi:hypothetical protein BDP55DRAFT_650854 [Colletotrichum godetiae]|uniref:Uncharacterized protein n=1 Tax=Colletotrichum godetiae TaxID=1209918 RepID=A0AAJ0AVB6_9PEZI|nr:uncharacterized protein BDP55DRAFT_650854 [Colletotrichum godetiae]KAK1690473.1 hypothetical protein BDP55DRAFT_650854 [Colletotrichum godetiae]
MARQVSLVGCMGTIHLSAACGTTCFRGICAGDAAAQLHHCVKYWVSKGYGLLPQCFVLRHFSRSRRISDGVLQCYTMRIRYIRRPFWRNAGNITRGRA